MDTEKMVAALRQALREPPSIVERLRQGLQDPYERALAIAQDYQAVRQARAARPKGQRPDGTPVTTTEKRQFLAAHEQRLAEQLAERGAQRVPVHASASAAEPSIPPGHVTPYGW